MLSHGDASIFDSRYARCTHSQSIAPMGAESRERTMSFRTITFATIVALLFATTTTTADWDPTDGHKMHWPQLPDLTPEGMDVLASLTIDPTGVDPVFKTLADDFRCTETGPITDIHIWGSWLNDFYEPVPNHGTFVLGIYSDIPASADGLIPSQPGELLWSMKFGPNQYQVHLEATGPEQFYDPNLNEVIGVDNNAWQYNFFIDEPLAFQQERDKVYWLSVMNVDPNQDGIIDLTDVSLMQAGMNRFGWKTSRDHWNDDAVFIDLPDVFNLPVDAIQPPNSPGAVLPWNELRYPINHPFAGESIDLAFVITPEPATLALLTLGALAALRRR